MKDYSNDGLEKSFITWIIDIEKRTGKEMKRVVHVIDAPHEMCLLRDCGRSYELRLGTSTLHRIKMLSMDNMSLLNILDGQLYLRGLPLQQVWEKAPEERKKYH